MKLNIEDNIAYKKYKPTIIRQTMSSIEQKINYQLNKYPKIKVYIKRAYQLACYAVSKKIKSEGNIVRVSPDEPGE